MTTLSIASGKRIAEVLNDKADLVNPENPIMEVKMEVLILIMWNLLIMMKQKKIR
mgnify:CR=1 FL=1